MFAKTCKQSMGTDSSDRTGEEGEIEEQMETDDSAGGK